MPVDWVDISGEPFLAWSDLLATIADGIKFVIQPNLSGARVYPNWIYEIDIATLLGKVTAPMIATEGTSEGKVHCWTLGISSATPVLNQQGETQYIGAQAYDWNLVIDIWGLWSYDGTSASQRLALDEARLVAATLRRNADEMVASVPNLAKVSAVSFTALQPTPFSDGKLISVASGAMQVTINEHFTV